MIRLLAIAGVACALQAAEPRPFMSFTDELPDGILVRFSTVIEPPLGRQRRRERLGQGPGRVGVRGVEDRDHGHRRAVDAFA